MRRLLSLFFLIAVLFSNPSFAVPPEAVMENDKALQFLQEENPGQAYQSLLKALELDPLNPYLQFNLGNIFAANEEFDKALKQFKLVQQLEVKDPELQFQARFNAGYCAAKAQNIDEALREYQLALEIHPDSQEVKTNIELLWQQSGQGGKGGGENKDEKKKDPSERDEEKQSPSKGDQEQKDPPKPKPKPFKSQELTKDQVRKILEELEAQEQKIREQENNQGGKEVPNEKDW